MPDLLTRVCGAAEVPALLPGLIEVYRQAFAGPPHHEGEAAVERFRDQQLPAHVGRDDFVLVVATVAGQVVGFVYGYTGRRGQYWPDLVVRSVSAEVADAWVGGHFEVVTLAVHPRAQGRGVGARLVTELLDAVPHSRALLGGPLVDSPARRLYRRLGWVALGDLGESTLFGSRGDPNTAVGCPESTADCGAELTPTGSVGAAPYARTHERNNRGCRGVGSSARRGRPLRRPGRGR